MLPFVVLLGLVNTSFIVGPEPAEAPVIPPVLVPNVHAKLLAVLAVRLTPGLVPLQVLAVVELVTDGVGFTVTVISVADPVHELETDVGITL
jgi:hypothetical protein